jgi:hypothetical protein
MLARMPYEIVSQMLVLQKLEGTLMRALSSQFPSHGHRAAWRVFDRFTQGWLNGTSLSDLAAVGVKGNAAGNAKRGSGNPLPKVIGLSENMILFSMTRITGAVASLIATAAEKETDLDWSLTDDSARSLELASLGMRAGCGDAASLAWWRFGGLRHRRLAHVAARLLPPPDDVLDTDERSLQWTLGARDSLLDPDFFLSDDAGLTESERRAFTAVVLRSTD